MSQPGDPSKLEFLKAKQALKDAFRASNDADEKASIRAAFDQVDSLEDAYDMERLRNVAGALTQAADRLQTVIDGIPVYWMQDSDQPRGDGSTGVPASTADLPSLGFYEQVMARVNLENIEDSLILKKPSGIHHYGGLAAINLGYNTERQVGHPDRVFYDMFVNWIAEGAACGGTSDQCVR